MRIKIKGKGDFPGLFCIKTLVLVLLTLPVLSGCGDRDEHKDKASAPAMKCGSGKCGSALTGGKTLLAKKKQNILMQMRVNDPRRECVIKAQTTKGVYDCVREPGGKRLTKKCGAEKQAMKCGTGKCGTE